MAITNGYCTLYELKHRLDIESSDFDTALEKTIEAASRAIDRNRGRRFYSASETRYFTAMSDAYVATDDFTSVTTVKTDWDADGTYETTIDSTEYWLTPYNAAVDGEPYRGIEIRSDSTDNFSTYPRGVEVAGAFGWSTTTPPEIREACLLACTRFFDRKDLRFGTAGGAELGTVEAIIPMLQDGELKTLLETIPKRRRSWLVLG